MQFRPGTRQEEEEEEKSERRSAGRPNRRWSQLANANYRVSKVGGGGTVANFRSQLSFEDCFTIEEQR